MRWCLLSLLFHGLLLQACDWPLWQQFKQQHMSEDGRIIDHGHSDRRSTSEGQAYALFFALLADEPETFARLLRWTENNLARGDLKRHLPAWLWGRRQDGQWAVVDSNTASDADLWMAYALLEAGRLWNKKEYTRMGQQLLNNIRSQESLLLPGVGWVILPGKQGFHTQAGTARLNPSYAVLFHWRRFALEDDWWARLVPATVKWLKASSPHGLAPDWASYRLGEGVRGEAQGSYDAIRVYLWLGMLADDDPEKAGLVKHFTPMLEHTRRLGHVPLRVQVHQGRVEGRGPAGFVAALQPLLGKMASVSGQVSGYYNQVLALFAQGLQRKAPDASGMLQPVQGACP